MVDVKDKNEEFKRVVKADGTVTDGTIITLNDEALKDISEKAEQVNANGFSTVKKLVTGLMGQAADAYEIKHNWHEGVDQMGSEPDKFDLLYRGCTIEVKTFDLRPYVERARLPSSYMAVPFPQFHNPERKYLFYIGNLQISINEICIMGFVSRKFLEYLESIHSIDDFDKEACDPDNRCVVVKNREDFVRIEHLDATIDYMLDSADKYLRSIKR